MSNPVCTALDRARRERPAPLPRDFADRVLRRTRRDPAASALPFGRAMALTAAAAVLVAAALTLSLTRPALSAEPPALGLFSTGSPLTTP